MKTILAVVLLMITALSIYTGSVEGPGGMKEQVGNTGGRMNVAIREINP
jgi:hypothetical protein